MTDNARQKALDALDKLFHYHGYTSWNVGPEKQEEIWKALKIIRAALQSQSEKDRVMKLMANTLKAVESRTSPEMAIAVSNALSEYTKLGNKMTDLDAIIQEIEGLKQDLSNKALDRLSYGFNACLDQVLSIIRKHQIKECEDTKGGA